MTGLHTYIINSFLFLSAGSCFVLLIAGYVFIFTGSFAMSNSDGSFLRKYTHSTCLTVMGSCYKMKFNVLLRLVGILSNI